MVKSGLIYPFGMGFWGPNGHDGIWHIALAESLSGGTWRMPDFSGDVIRNYHLGFDLILAILHKVTFIPTSILYFQILPPLMAILIGVFAYLFISVWTKSEKCAFWGTFFIYFGGGFGWLVTLIKTGKFGGESVFWSQQSISTLVNPPFALSLIFIFAGLYYLTKGLKTKDRKFLIIATFLFGLLIQIKVYAGILVIAALSASGILRIIYRNDSSLFKVAIGSLVVSILLFSSLNTSLNSSIIFKPFWFLEEVMSSADHFYWPRFAEAMINYKLGENWLKAFLAYGFSLLLFLMGNFGTRLISLFWIVKKGFNYKNYRYIEIIVVVITILGVLIPLLFIQSGTPWNTIQFMYYSLIFSGILSGVWLGRFMENKNTKSFFRYATVVLILVLTLPTTTGTLQYNYLPPRPPAKISNEELEALKFLKRQPAGIILTEVFDRDAANNAINNPPRPLYLYESSAYVSAFTGKAVYMEDEVNLEITGYDWRGRRANEESFFRNPSLNFIEENDISYIYDINRNVAINNLGLKTIFENSEVTVWGK